MLGVLYALCRSMGDAERNWSRHKRVRSVLSVLSDVQKEVKELIRERERLVVSFADLERRATLMLDDISDTIASQDRALVAAKNQQFLHQPARRFCCLCF